GLARSRARRDLRDPGSAGGSGREVRGRLGLRRRADRDRDAAWATGHAALSGRAQRHPHPLAAASAVGGLPAARPRRVRPALRRVGGPREVPLSCLPPVLERRAAPDQVPRGAVRVRSASPRGRVLDGRADPRLVPKGPASLMLIDLHAHYVPPVFLETIEKEGAPFGASVQGDGGDPTIVVGGRPYGPI